MTYNDYTVGQKVAVHVVAAIMLIASVGVAWLLATRPTLVPAHAEPTASAGIQITGSPAGSGTVGIVSGPLSITAGSGSIGATRP